jgi:methylated-DNA-[protein]-cysteine S-methyltransferase
MTRGRSSAPSANAASAITIDSPAGRLHLAATREGLTHLLFAGRARGRLPGGDGSTAAARILGRVRRQLDEYFAGLRRAFDIPLAPRGTPFRMAVWTALRDIPYGETISYGELARRIGRARAVRAVGAANGANPISIIIPCHRVIGGDGSLTGYGGGLPAKRSLLKLEGVRLEGDRLRCG